MFGLLIKFKEISKQKKNHFELKLKHCFENVEIKLFWLKQIGKTDTNEPISVVHLHFFPKTPQTHTKNPFQSALVQGFKQVKRGPLKAFEQNKENGRTCSKYHCYQSNMLPSSCCEGS